MLYSSHLDEADIGKLTCKVWASNYDKCDNTSAINISKNPIMHSKTKHIPIKYHFLRDQVSKSGQIGIYWY